MSKIICLYGLPACGKTTQGELLVRELGWQRFGMGDVLRREIATNSDLGKQIKKYVDEGVLIPDDLMTQVLKNLSEFLGEQNLVFDGFPRIVSQAQMLDEATRQIGRVVDKFIYLKISPSEALARIEARSLIEERADDQDLSAVNNRLNVFREESAKLIEYYQSQNKLVEIDGQLAIGQVYQEIIKVI